jgi:uncharacterized protein (TIGR02757 family)
MLTEIELNQFLNEKVALYNTPAFIETDPIQIPHRFSKQEDIEISAFLTSSIAWGKRSIIINNASKLMQLMDNTPYEFIMGAGKAEFKRFSSFKHRTFNAEDLFFYIQSLSHIYKDYGGLSKVFQNDFQDVRTSLIKFRKIFLSADHKYRAEKHVPDVLKNSAAKRLNLFLMWMVRKDKVGVHFGLWDKINPSELKLPLDVHTANVGRKLGLISRRQNDWNAVEEITGRLRKFDSKDPVKYDFALFGLGVFENF